MEEANLSGAELYFADLCGTNFENTNIEIADFSGVKNLTAEQIFFAQNWKQAKYDPDLLARIEILDYQYNACILLFLIVLLLIIRSREDVKLERLIFYILSCFTVEIPKGCEDDKHEHSSSKKQKQVKITKTMKVIFPNEQ